MIHFKKKRKRKKLLRDSLIIKHCCIILSTLLNLYRIKWILTKQQGDIFFRLRARGSFHTPVVQTPFVRQFTNLMYIVWCFSAVSLSLLKVETTGFEWNGPVSAQFRCGGAAAECTAPPPGESLVLQPEEEKNISVSCLTFCLQAVTRASHRSVCVSAEFL